MRFQSMVINLKARSFLTNWTFQFEIYPRYLVQVTSSKLFSPSVSFGIWSKECFSRWTFRNDLFSAIALNFKLVWKCMVTQSSLHSPRRSIRLSLSQSVCNRCVFCFAQIELLEIALLHDSSRRFCIQNWTHSIQASKLESLALGLFPEFRPNRLKHLKCSLPNIFLQFFFFWRSWPYQVNPNAWQAKTVKYSKRPAYRLVPISGSGAFCCKATTEGFRHSMLSLETQYSSE